MKAVRAVAVAPGYAWMGRARSLNSARRTRINPPLTIQVHAFFVTEATKPTSPRQPAARRLSDPLMNLGAGALDGD